MRDPAATPVLRQPYRDKYESQPGELSFARLLEVSRSASGASQMLALSRIHLSM